MLHHRLGFASNGPPYWKECLHNDSSLASGLVVMQCNGKQGLLFPIGVFESSHQNSTLVWCLQPSKICHDQLHFSKDWY
jgi:hypothetical protein